MSLDIKILNFLEKECYIFLMVNWEEEAVMEEIIKRIRRNRVKVKQLYNIIKKDIDNKSEIIDSRIIEELMILSKIDEELIDIIYLVKDNKKSKNQ